jgi:hypothetical protein
MTEQAAKSLATVLGGEVDLTMPQSRMPGVRLGLADGRVAMIDTHGGETFRSPADMEAYFDDGDHEAHIVASAEWTDWDGTEEWARGLVNVLGAEEYWHSGGGIWLVFYNRPDGRFVVIGSESGGVYASREEFEADEYGEKAENHVFV